MKTYSVTDDPTVKCSTFVDALMGCGLATSRSDARRVIESGGCYVNHEQLKADRPISTDDFLHGKNIIIRRGKKLMNTRLLSFEGVEEFFK